METTEIYKRVKLSNSNNLIAIIQEENDGFFITVFDEFNDYEGGIYIEDVAYTQQDAEIKTDKIINNIIKKY
jgi:hypothetical protein